MNNKLIKILISLPVILIFLYFIPFLGICLLIFKLIIKKEIFKTAKIFISLAIIIFIPKIINYFIEIINIDISISQFINIDLYNKLFNYGKFILTIGILLIILQSLLKNTLQKLKSNLTNSINKYQQINYEISKENDLKIKEKQYRSKNTHVVFCANCGASNTITDSTGICNYCRNNLEYKNEIKKD